METFYNNIATKGNFLIRISNQFDTESYEVYEHKGKYFEFEVSGFKVIKTVEHRTKFKEFDVLFNSEFNEKRL